MKLASLSSLVTASGRIFLRFPATLLSAILAATVAIRLVKDQEPPERAIHLVMVAALGIPLFIGLRLFWEKSPWGRPLRFAWAPMIGGAIVLFLYWTQLNQDPGEARFLRYCQISLAVHLFVALAPFLGRGETNGFWQFNRRLFLRCFLSGIYAAVFFGGLALAVLAVDHLFEVKIEDRIYPRLWLFTVFVFQTWHFLGGVPTDLVELDRDREHPKALQIFSQYMLVPLVVLYVVILYAYMGKILLSREWPQGWVGWLVSCAAVFGVLTLLLLHPGKQERENRWMETFGRGFHIAILPLLGLLFAALSRRVGQYAWTERRYFLLVLGLWLFGVALYMLFSRAKNIKIVPATLALTAIVTSCGPWGAYGISLGSQSRRLETLLTKHGLLSDGRIVASTAPVAVDPDDLKEISAIVHYLVVSHGAVQLNRWDKKDWAAVASGRRRWERPARISEEFLATMGLEYAESWRQSSRGAFYNASRDEEMEIAGYELLVRVELSGASRDGAPGAAAAGQVGGDPGKYSARLGDQGRAVEILKGATVVLTESLTPLLGRLAERVRTAGKTVPASDLCLEAADASLRARLCFTTLGVMKGAKGEASVQHGSGYLLIDPIP